MKYLFLNLFFLVVSVLCVAQTEKRFELYDAMSYPGKPDLSQEGLLPVFLMYESALLKIDIQDSTKHIPDMEKINVMAEAAARNFPHVMISTDIEAWFWDPKIGADEMPALFSQVFQVFRTKNPDVKIGNYGIAPLALSLHRFFVQDTIAVDEADLIDRWVKNNHKGWQSLYLADMAQAEAYIASPYIKSWIEDLKLTVAETKRRAPDKKIIVYIWPQYFDKPGSPYHMQFVSPVIWSQLLEAAYEYCDGAIIWSSISGPDGKKVSWTDPEPRQMWEATKKFIQKYRENIVKPVAEPEIQVTGKSKKKFKVYSTMDMDAAGLKKQNSRRLRVVQEQEIGTLDENKIYRPDPVKIAKWAKELPPGTEAVCIDAPGWIKNKAVLKQADNPFATAKNIFKKYCPGIPLSFVQAAPDNISISRSSYSNFYTVYAGWLLNSVIPARQVGSYADILIQDARAIDDDTISWKRGFALAIQEIRQSHPGKPVYAHFHTSYFNPENTNQPVKAETWKVMMETASKLCDGIIISGTDEKDVHVVTDTDNK